MISLMMAILAAASIQQQPASMSEVSCDRLAEVLAAYQTEWFPMAQASAGTPAERAELAAFAERLGAVDQYRQRRNLQPRPSTTQDTVLRNATTNAQMAEFERRCIAS